jgi:hypothetical protein
MRKLFFILSILFLVLPNQAANVAISGLPAITSPSTNTFIEVSDMDAATKSRKYLLTNLVKKSEIDTEAELEALVGALNIIMATEINTIAKIETLAGSVNILLETEIDGSSELLALMDDETGTGLLVFGTSPTFTTSIIIGSAGVSITEDGDGAITFLGRGNGTDEDLTLNFDDTSNTIVASSSTGVTLFSFGAIGLGTDTLTLSGTGTINGLDAIDATSETTLEAALDIGGEVTSTGMGSTVIADSVGVANWTLTTPTISGAITFPDNTRQAFNPGANAAGLNVGSHAGDPDTPSNGDIWYDSSANELTARINGANVALGAGGGGATAWDDIGDPDAGTVIAFAGFTNQITSTLDGGIVWSIYNTTADHTSDTVLLDLAINDSGDANSIFIRARRDIDGTPATVFQIDDSGGATFGTGNGQVDLGTAGVRLTSDGDGAITLLGMGNGSDEDLTINLDDTANTIVLSSSTGVTVMDFGTIGADFDSSSLKLPTAADPDVATEGLISYDSNGDYIRGYDGTAQVALGRKIEAIHVTVIAPNDLADAQRDAFLFWSNESGMSFVITGWKGWAGTDDTTLNIEKVDADGVGTNTTVDAVELATGTGPYTGSDTTITSATIENGKMLVLDFDDTDTPTFVKMTIYGYFAADVN